MMDTLLIFLAVGLVLAAVLLLRGARRTHQATGLPEGRVTYNDARPGRVPERPFYDPILGLTGKPDYLVEYDGAQVPVEVKSGWAPPAPREGHVLQALAYCYLVERATGKRPPHALLRYRNRTFMVEYSHAAEAELRAVIEEMRADERKRELHRSHEDPNRCKHCGFVDVCEEAISD